MVTFNLLLLYTSLSPPFLSSINFTLSLPSPSIPYSDVSPYPSSPSSVICIPPSLPPVSYSLLVVSRLKFKTEGVMEG